MKIKITEMRFPPCFVYDARSGECAVKNSKQDNCKICKGITEEVL